MTIEKAIAEAKENNYWISDKPTSVNVGYYNYVDEESMKRSSIYGKTMREN